MRQAFQRRASTRWAWPASTAANWASKTTAKTTAKCNCQVAVSLSLASACASIPIAYQLYLPKDWAADQARRKAAGVAQAQAFATKPQIALAQMRQAVAAGVPMGMVLADAGYADETAFRDGITELGMLYAVGIRPATTAGAPGTEPLPPKAWSGRGPVPTRLRRQPGNEPFAVRALACGLWLASAQLAYRDLAGRHQQLPERTFRFSAGSSGSSG
jgi:SRSO17 transposase